LLIEVVLVRCQ